jgi:hypothetical protein
MMVVIGSEVYIQVEIQKKSLPARPLLGPACMTC